MGVFSTVTFRCKECGLPAVDFQTKAGPECEHYIDGKDELPASVVSDLVYEEASCAHCGRAHRVRARVEAWVEPLP